MAGMPWEAVAYLAFYAVVVFATLFWVLPAFWRWLFFAPPPPPSDAEPGSLAYQMDELTRATDEARREIGSALLPVVERAVQRLGALLDRKP